MTFTAEQKSQLAKLMATENLTVQHQKIHTAKFDPMNRILYLPIWQNMSGDLYDLLTGHEVGHALYTPADGWHSAASDKSKPASYKNFLNVVEDARIEKKVKRRYPGLKSSFQKAYKELFDRDFFGLRNREPNEMAFIDRLNIFTKSQYTATWIKFSAEEQKFVDEIENIETWADVVRLTDKIFEYSKHEQFEMQNYDFEYQFSEDEDGDDSFDNDSGEYGDEDDSGEDLDSNSTKNSKSDEDGEETDGSEDGEKPSEGDGDTEDEFDNGEKTINREKESRLTDKDQFTPECVTDEEFRKRENLLLDEQSQPYLYLNLPKYDKKYSITPAKRVIDQIEDFYTRPIDDYIRIAPEKARELVNEFKNRNERFIGLLVKEFEMRKAAKSYSKSRLSDTGDIDINKLSSYKFDDNIFRKVMLTPKGKNHGLVLLLDKSGSMSDNMPGSIEQILILAMFCRKVNIPFVVYGFGGETDAYYLDHGHNGYNNIFSMEDKDLCLTPVFMREYLNSSMSNSEFSRATKALLCLKQGYEIRWLGQPRSESLSNTPLNEAIFATGHIMNEFRKKHNLDLSSLIIVHDGDSDQGNRYYQKDNDLGRVRVRHYSTDYEKVIVQDVPNKFQYKLTTNQTQYDPLLLCALNWFQKTTGSKVFGFFLTSSGRYAKGSIQNRYVFDDGEHFYTKYQAFRRASNWSDANALEEKLNKIIKQFKDEKFVACKTRGYSDFYIIAGGQDLNNENEEIEIEGKVTASKLKNAFMKYNKKRAINRVLVSRFIQGIAA